MKVLVIGGTGTVGSEVTQRLLDRGAAVWVMTYTEGRAGALPAGAEGMRGDLRDPGSLRAPFAGVEGVFLLVPVSLDETRMGLNAVDAAKASGVHRIVYMSVAKVEEASHIPHFGSKIPIENAVKSSGIPYTILRPNNFYQNDRWLREWIVDHGVYPQPIGDIGVNRVDVRDIADAAVNALTKSGHEGNTYGINGPDTLTGDAVASIYSRYLGREVRYEDGNLDAWEEQARRMFPDWMAHDYRIMYEYFQSHGMVAAAADLAGQHSVVGHDPRSFDAYASELTAVWIGRKAAA